MTHVIRVPMSAANRLAFAMRVGLVTVYGYARASVDAASWRDSSPAVRRLRVATAGTC
ncbi:MAG: hypothetical protein KJO36_13640 [Acidimicrobiia bacterium]|nr:hypothetical protein [Acidimicrobiia bacterium]NNC42668.1 hypothetical protein [Acidimicrobiia bacterium]NNL49157.1 hypothetical protein [Acidimicrobiia bacterium]